MWASGMKALKTLVVLGNIGLLFLMIAGLAPELFNSSSTTAEQFAIFFAATGFILINLLVLIRSRLPGDESYWSLWVRARKERLRREIEGSKP